MSVSAVRLIFDKNPELAADLDTQQNAIHFNSEIVNTVTTNAVTVDLAAASNHQTIDLTASSGTTAITLTPPKGVASGRLLITNNANNVAATWAATGRTVKWLTTEPDLSTDTDDRIVSYTDDGTSIYLLSSVSAQQVSGLTAWADVTKFGADPTGAADSTPGFDAAVASLASGGTVYVPTGTYTLNSAVKIPDGVSVVGDGYGSHIRPGIAVVWPGGADDDLGMLSIVDSNATRISNLRIDARATEWEAGGPTLTDTADYPKLIYGVRSTGLLVNDCWLENCTYEGLWGDVAAIVQDCYFNDVGNCRNTDLAWTALPAFNFFGAGCQCIGNLFDSCGKAVHLWASEGIIANNVMVNCKEIGASIGDGGPQESGSIIGNEIYVNSSAAKPTAGILLKQGDTDPAATPGTYLVAGNTVRTKQEVGHQQAAGIEIATAGRSQVIANTIILEEAGTGIVGGTTSGDRWHWITNNNVLMINERAAALAKGIAVYAGTDTTHHVLATDNVVHGISVANSGFAYDFAVSGNGVMVAQCRRNWTDGGQIRVQYDTANSTTWGADELANQYWNADSDPASTGDYNKTLTASYFRTTVDPASSGLGTDGTLDLSGQSVRGEYKIQWSLGTELHTINGLPAWHEFRLLLRYDGNSRTMNVQHGTGNIYLKGGVDITLKSGVGVNAGPRYLSLIVDENNNIHEL